MRDDAKLRKDAQKGAKARSIFESDEYKDAIASAKARWMQTWLIESRAEERDRIWLLLKAMDQITDELIAVANNGAVAVAQLEQK